MRQGEVQTIFPYRGRTAKAEHAAVMDKAVVLLKAVGGYVCKTLCREDGAAEVAVPFVTGPTQVPGAVYIILPQVVGGLIPRPIVGLATACDERRLNLAIGDEIKRGLARRGVLLPEVDLGRLCLAIDFQGEAEDGAGAGIEVEAVLADAGVGGDAEAGVGDV